MPGPAVLLMLQVGGTLAAAAAVAGWRRRATFPAAWVCLLVLAGLRSSQGKLLHNDLLLLLAAVPFLAAPEVRWRTTDRQSVRFGWPVRTATVVVAGTYFFSGLAKLVHSGPAWVLSDNMGHVLSQAAGGGKVAFPEVPTWLAGRGGLAHGLAAGVLLLELTFPVVLLAHHRRMAAAPAAYAAGAAALHAGTWLALGLDYWAWAAVAVVVLVDGRHLIERLSHYRLGSRPRLRPGAGNPAWPADVVPAEWRKKAEDLTCENAAAGVHASAPPRSPSSPSPSS